MKNFCSWIQREGVIEEEDLHDVRGGDDDFDAGDDAVDDEDDSDKDDVRGGDYASRVDMVRLDGGVPGFVAIISGDGFGCGDIY